MAKKTKLTQALRDVIRERVTNDIPKVDYDSQIQDFLNKAAWQQLPFDLQKEEFRDYIGQARVRFCGVYITNPKYEPTEAQIKHVRSLQQLDSDQRDNLNRVSRNVRAFLSSFNYVEDLVEQAPDFAEYAPKADAPITNLPAVQLTEQLHALGWPKSDAGK